MDRADLMEEADTTDWIRWSGQALGALEKNTYYAGT